MGARPHPYYTERVLERSARAGQLDVGARLSGAADSYDAMTDDRPYRPALSPAAARAELRQMVRAGTFEKRTTDAVLEAAGEQQLDVRQGHAAGLTDREVEVLRLIARGRGARTRRSP